MKTKMARKAERHAKPMRKSVRGKKHTRAAAHVSKKETPQPVAVEQEIMEAAFEVPVEFVELELEPVVEVIEVYESEGGDDDS